MFVVPPCSVLQDAINRQNAAFCCGILVEVCPSATSGFMQQVLMALHPMFGEEEEPGARDNAAGAVGRMLLAYGGNLPLEQVLPVLLGALPLKVGLGSYGQCCSGSRGEVEGGGKEQRVLLLLGMTARKKHSLSGRGKLCMYMKPVTARCIFASAVSRQIRPLTDAHLVKKAYTVGTGLMLECWQTSKRCMY